jgi:hypothetical protein
VTKRYLVNLTHGPNSDSIWCDVIPMTITHILLGRPWLYDREVKHEGKENTYSFGFNGKQIVLKPLSAEAMRERQVKRPSKHEEEPPKVKIGTKKKSLQILSRKSFEKEAKHTGVIFMVVGKEKNHPVFPNHATNSPELSKLLADFADVAPKDLPKGLSPMRDIQHAIDFVPGSHFLTYQPIA